MASLLLLFGNSTKLSRHLYDRLELRQGQDWYASDYDSKSPAEIRKGLKAVLIG
jgi:hypothetical protein